MHHPQPLLREEGKNIFISKVYCDEDIQ